MMAEFINELEEKMGEKLYSPVKPLTDKEKIEYLQQELARTRSYWDTAIKLYHQSQERVDAQHIGLRQLNLENHLLSERNKELIALLKAANIDVPLHL